MVLNSKDESKQLLQAKNLEIYLKLRKTKNLQPHILYWLLNDEHMKIYTQILPLKNIM